MTLWTVARQVPLSMEFSRQGYQSGLPCPPSGDLPDPGSKPRSPALQADSLLSEPPGKPPASRTRGLTAARPVSPPPPHSCPSSPSALPVCTTFCTSLCLTNSSLLFSLMTLGYLTILFFLLVLQFLSVSSPFVLQDVSAGLTALC